MECKKAKEKLSSFIDNELKGADREKINQHLANCPFCRKEAKMLAQAWGALEVWENIEASDNFEEKFWQRVREERRRKSSIRGLIRKVVDVPLPAAAAVILALGLIGGSYLGNLLYPEGKEISSDKIVSSTQGDSLYLNLDAFGDVPSKSIGEVYFSLFLKGEGSQQEGL